jgi:spore germination cell wall hydrolase CwlJ-like protein
MMKRLGSICLLYTITILILVLSIKTKYEYNSIVDNNIKKPVIEVIDVSSINIVETKIEEVKNTYSQEDLELLARLIQAEVGSDNCSNYLQQCVASVVLNRVVDQRYPDTIHDVIYDKKHGQQYGCIKNKAINNKPSERAISNAKYVLEFGSILPKEVIFQSEWKLGIVYRKELNQYFCKG